MELKEIVNLRKLKEFYDSANVEDICKYCPFKNICQMDLKNINDVCLLERILGIDNDNFDLYDLEAIDNLTESYQLKCELIE